MSQPNRHRPKICGKTYAVFETTAADLQRRADEPQLEFTSEGTGWQSLMIHTTSPLFPIPEKISKNIQGFSYSSLLYLESSNPAKPSEGQVYKAQL